MQKDNGLIPTHGGYRRLKSFQIAQLIYDFTVRFCELHIDRRSRIHDQMVQAARFKARRCASMSDILVWEEEELKKYRRTLTDKDTQGQEKAPALSMPVGVRPFRKAPFSRPMPRCRC